MHLLHALGLMRPHVMALQCLPWSCALLAALSSVTLPKSVESAPACTGGPLPVQPVKLSMDVLMLAPSSLAAASLEAEVVQPAIAAQLEHFRDALTQEDQPLCDQRALHFQPPGWPHPLTVIYPLRGGGAGMVTHSPAFAPYTHTFQPACLGLGMLTCL